MNKPTREEVDNWRRAEAWNHLYEGCVALLNENESLSNQINALLDENETLEKRINDFETNWYSPKQVEHMKEIVEAARKYRYEKENRGNMVYAWELLLGALRRLDCREM